IPARGIHCEACSRKIIRSLSPIPGVRKVIPDVTRKEVFVAFEPSRVSEEQLRGQLAQFGFR
ncbi:MAG TPA: heavy-metal-associated domain-containing protein, partial [Blastocatellia bacterium]|nr:heavy-metal-associated domain-containing protein [Blastocatellia bacterium]